LSEAPIIIEHMFEINPRLAAGIGEVGPEPDWSQAVGPGCAPEDWNGPDLDVACVTADSRGRGERRDGVARPVIGLADAAVSARSRISPDEFRPAVVDAGLDWSLAMDGDEDQRLADELHLDAPSPSGWDWSPEHDPGVFPPPWDEPAPDLSPLIAEWSWADAPPGAGLAVALDELPAALLDDYDLVEAIAGWERIAAWAAARQASAVAELSHRPVFAGLRVTTDGIDPVRATALEIAARLRVSHQEATYRVVVAQELTTQRQATLAALRTGQIDLRRARTIVDGVQILDTDRAAVVEARLLATAAEQTPPAFRRRVEQQVAAADPSGFEQRHQRAMTDRQVRCRPEADAMGSLWALLPAAGTALVNTVLDAAADAMKTGHPHDGRTHAQRRADALVAMAELAWQTGHLGGARCGPRLARRQRRRVEIGVLVPYPTLLGLTDAPGELAGFGPIPASVARRIAAGGVWRRILTDPISGRVLDYGKTRYRPPQDLVDHVIARDRTCRGVACNRRAETCDIDHTINYPDGPTADWNLGPFCRPEHNGKTCRLWQVSQPRPGHFCWRSPTGHTYSKDPDPIGPIIEAPADGAATRRTDPPDDPDPPPF
jgi:Domain of unknown function (DUF222)